MIEITESAVSRLKELSAEKGGVGLRLGVEKGGCAGLQYAMSLGASRPGDHLIGREGAVVSIDPGSVPHLEGCTIDFVDDLTGAGFRIINPKAARSCGCGTSFEAADAPGHSQA